MFFDICGFSIVRQLSSKQVSRKKVGRVVAIVVVFDILVFLNFFYLEIQTDKGYDNDMNFSH